ncbi:MAG TPA: tyrosine-type recombinase/integrase [Syntrophorhabdaceae bacterium]|nr:tyrosine-type recombinase/integrase [Syntrophorhabdaceae bacterium]
MKGGIFCNACSKAMHKQQCICGKIYCYIKYYHEGRAYYVRKGHNQQSLTYKEAVDKLASITLAIRNPRKAFDPINYNDESALKRKFSTQIALWLAEQGKKKKANEMKPSYFNSLRSYDRMHFKRLYRFEMQEIGKREISNFKDSMQHLKAKTRKNVMSALHAFFTWFADQVIENDLIPDYEVPSFPKIRGRDSRVTRALSREAQEAHLQEVPERHRDIFRFAMLVGCRRSEVTAYKVKDVDLENGMILTERAWSGNEIGTPKNGEAAWKVLFDDSYEIAKKHMQGKTKEQWLFINPDTGNHYLPNKIDKLWSATTSEVKFHEATRHSFATRLLEEGLSASDVLALGSWKDMQSMKPYSHVNIMNIKARVVDMRNSYRTHTVVKTRKLLKNKD